VLFDVEVSYELAAATTVDRSAPRFFVTTRLSVQPDLVEGRRQLFQDLWDSADDLA
jgi:hypothetical protein